MADNTDTDAAAGPDDLARHAAKMAKKKAARDKIMAGKAGEKGLIIVHTGAGKGKSSSGFGMILRCIAHGMPCAVVQFIKGAWDTGERDLIEKNFGDTCQFYTLGEGFTWETQDRARDVRAAERAWAASVEMIEASRGAEPAYDLVVLDELNIALRYEHLDAAEVARVLAARPPMLHVVVTGRNAPQALIDAADLVTEMTLVKHPFAAGVRAQKGIEF